MSQRRHVSYWDVHPPLVRVHLRCVESGRWFRGSGIPSQRINGVSPSPFFLVWSIWSTPQIITSLGEAGHIWVWFGFRSQAPSSTWSCTVILNWPTSPLAKVEKCYGEFYSPQPIIYPAARGEFRLGLFLANFEMFWHVYLFNLFILTGSDCNWQQCVELTLGSVLDLSVTITPKACEENATRYMTIASGEEHLRDFFPPKKERRPQVLNFILKYTRAIVQTVTRMLTFLFSHKPALAAHRLVRWLLKVAFLTVSPLEFVFWDFLLFYLWVFKIKGAITMQ